jgi:hypothetical protein
MTPIYEGDNKNFMSIPHFVRTGLLFKLWVRQRIGTINALSLEIKAYLSTFLLE